jgi:uncharacterized protein YcbX
LPCIGILRSKLAVFFYRSIDSSGKQEKMFTRLVSLKGMRFWDKGILLSCSAYSMVRLCILQSAMLEIGQVAYIARYLVKSMAGEIVEQANLTESGLDGDRLYAFESSSAPTGMLRVSNRERREMLRYQPHLIAGGKVEVLCPTGELFPVESQGLLDYLRNHTLDSSTFSLTQASTPQTDVRPLSLISLQTIHQLSAEIDHALDPRRFRANLYLDLPNGPFLEDNQVGRVIRIGSVATVLIRERSPRCRFITYDPEAPHTTDPLFSLMKLLDRNRQGRVGVYASIVVPGHIQADDPVWQMD